MNGKTFDHILEECITRLQADESVPEILESYPEIADRLRPLLLVAARGRDLPKPEARREAREMGRTKVLKAANRLQRYKGSMTGKSMGGRSRFIHRVIGWIRNIFVKKEKTEMKLAYRIVIYTLVTVIVGGVFTINASAESLPGDPLYGVKRGWERARLALTLSQEAERELGDQFEEERLEEVSTLVGSGQLADVEFTDTVLSVDGNLWEIGGFDVRVDENTELSGNPEVGSKVEVEGQTQEDGTILAREIQVLSGDGMEEGDDDDGDDTSGDDDVAETEEVEVEETGTPEPTDGEMDDMDSEDDYEGDSEEEEDGMDSEDDEDTDSDDDGGYDETEVFGTLESVTRDSLVVDGNTYLITEDSDLEDELQVGDDVKITYYENDEGHRILLDIDVESNETATPMADDDMDDDSDDEMNDDGDDNDDDSDEGEEDEGAETPEPEEEEEG